MRTIPLVMCLLCIISVQLIAIQAANNIHGADVEDNEFAEFEDFDEQAEVITDDNENEDVKVQSQETIEDEEEDGVVEDEDEFGHFTDEEEFEGFEGAKPVKGKSQETPDLKIANVPAHLRANFEGYYVEMLMMAGLGVYFINFLAGRSKNQRLAQTWFQAHRELLEKNFEIVGDDGTTTEVQKGVLMKESEHSYSLWCSGRVCCEGMLVELKLLKRQDLINTIARFFKPVTDQVTIQVTLDSSVMDSFVFAVAQKKTASRIQKEIFDLNLLCPDRKSGEAFKIPSSFSVLSEIGEATGSMLDTKAVTMLEKYEANIDYIHFSDQYSGAKPTEDQEVVKPPETKKVLIFCFNVGKKGKASVDDMQAMVPLLQFVFYCIDKVAKFKLSSQARAKAVKNRQKLAESFQKMTHTQRAEAAQTRREDKIKSERERMMAEEDPEKQRKMDEQLNRKEAKKKQGRMKVMKVKSM